MLQVIRNWEKQDYLRHNQGNRGYGLKIQNMWMPLPIMGAYSDTQRTIVYLIARQIDDKMNVITSYDIDTSLITYEDGQYCFDKSKTLGGLLPEGVYYYEFNDGYETYFTEIFKVEDITELDLASCSLPISDEDLISSLNINTHDLIILKQFEVTNNYVQFEDH
jgi:hypothetical protein